MPAPRQLPDNETLKNLRRQGWSYADIAEEYGVTKGAVYLHLQEAGATRKRPSYKHLIPWTVRSEHQYAHPPMMLRLLGRREAGLQIPPVKERMLDKWLRETKEAGVVVMYHPETPPNPASPTVGGWYYAARVEEDGDALIRYEEDGSPPKVPEVQAAS